MSPFTAAYPKNAVRAVHAKRAARHTVMGTEEKKDLLSLITAVRQGDDDACAELIRMYAPLIGGIVRSTTLCLPASSKIDEDELRQEAAIKLYQSALNYDPESEVSFGLYAKLCIKNRMISILRGQRSESEKSTVELSDDLPGADGDPSELLLREEHETELERRIKKILSPLEFDVFNLYIEGIGPTEIAAALSVSVKTAENAIYRLRTKIQKLLL